MLEIQALPGDGTARAAPHDPAAGVPPGSPVLVLMHGRGADPADLAPLRRFFPEDVVVVLAAAPFEAAEWGYGPGRAWYLYEGEDRPEVETFRRAQAELEETVGRLPHLLGAEPGPLVLGGFSQGGTMSIAYALRRPDDVAGVLNFSGFVVSHPDVPLGDAASAAAGTPVFWGHGTADPNIPFAMAREGRERLRAAGLEVEAHDYAIGHAIIPEELRDARTWLGRVIGKERP